MKRAIAISLGWFFLPTLVFASYTPQDIVNATNKYREESKLSKLTINATLQGVAQFVADDMAKRRYWSHVNPEGVDSFFWLKAVNYKYRYAGQNLASGFTNAQSNMEEWIKSPTHKANVVNKNFEEIGVGMATAKDGTVYVVQYFGTR